MKHERSGEKRHGRSRRKLTLDGAWSEPKPSSVATWNARNHDLVSCRTTRMHTEWMQRRRDSPEGREGSGRNLRTSSRLFPLYWCFRYSSFPALLLENHRVCDPGYGVRPGWIEQNKGKNNDRGILNTNQKRVGVKFDICAFFYGLDFCVWRNCQLDRTGTTSVMCCDVMRCEFGNIATFVVWILCCWWWPRIFSLAWFCVG